MKIKLILNNKGVWFISTEHFGFILCANSKYLQKYMAFKKIELTISTKKIIGFYKTRQSTYLYSMGGRIIPVSSLPKSKDRDNEVYIVPSVQSALIMLLNLGDDSELEQFTAIPFWWKIKTLE
jgi:hypothetical protein